MFNKHDCKHSSYIVEVENFKQERESDAIFISFHVTDCFQKIILLLLTCVSTMEKP